jgi:hypothetical protein
MTEPLPKEKKNWEKLPPLELEGIHVGCLCCSTAARVAPLGMGIAVGFGSAYVTKDGEQVYDGESDWQNGREPKTVEAIEAMARKDPDHDWRIVKWGPLHGETFQRHCENTWVCVESNEGFA